ncbi:MAG: proline dehydrogenase [Chlorobi bacterium]|nr:proline dehydrogenase [Chlorobiota bacterium]
MNTFENTEIAFKYKSNFELKKAYYLFKTISMPWLVKLSNSLLNFALKINLPVKWIIKPTVYSHFVGGESLQKCDRIVKLLGRYNVKSILDYSVEGKEEDEDIEMALQETLASIKNAGTNNNIPFAVFKPTAFAKSYILEKASSEESLNENDKIEFQKFRERVNELCKTAHKNNIPILIDAEDHCYQLAIDKVVTEMLEKYNKEKPIVFITLQMYRKDRIAFLKDALKRAENKNYFLGTKYVRGAYMEKERERAAKMGYPDPIQPDKESTDRDYNAALKFTVEHIDKMALFNGSHNEESNEYLTHLMEKYNLAKNDERIWFAQLYGMSDHISFNLAKEGYNVAKYVPYGPLKYVMPYLMRRAEENTSVAGQTSRELSLLTKEIKRRKNKA